MMAYEQDMLSADLRTLHVEMFHLLDADPLSALFAASAAMIEMRQQGQWHDEDRWRVFRAIGCAAVDVLRSGTISPRPSEVSSAPDSMMHRAAIASRVLPGVNPIAGR